MNDHTRYAVVSEIEFRDYQNILRNFALYSTPVISAFVETENDKYKVVFIVSDKLVNPELVTIDGDPIVPVDIVCSKNNVVFCGNCIVMEILEKSVDEFLSEFYGV